MPDPQPRVDRILTGMTERDVQLWLNDDTHVFTRFQRLAGERLVVEFGLERMWDSE